jgi:hypothetical protein
MSKRLQIILNDDAWAQVEAITNEANEGFQAGSISYSDTMAEMVLNSKVDVKLLQLKHTDFRRAMRNAAKEGLELDSVIKMLQELKAGTHGKRSHKAGAQKEGGSDD